MEINVVRNSSKSIGLLQYLPQITLIPNNLVTYSDIHIKKQFDVGAKELEHLYKEADQKFDELSQKAEENYKDAKAFIELTNKALKHSFNYFMSHYRK